MTAWVEVLVAMVDGPSKPITGVVESVVPEGYSETFAVAGPRMMTPWLSERVRMYRDGAKLAVELLDGTPLFRTDGETAWRWEQPGEPPLSGPARRLYYSGPGRQLMQVRPAGDWAGSDDFTRPTQRPIETVEFLGRPAWAVELAPPRHKPAPIGIVVDRETGAVVEERSDHFGLSSSYVEFEVVESIDPAVFAYEGPVASMEDRQEQMRREHEVAARDQRAWFAANVGATHLSVPVRIALDVEVVHTDGTDGGHVEASLRADRGGSFGAVARRDRADTEWELRWSEPGVRWSTADHDWALVIYGVGIDDDAVAALAEQLHPGVEARLSAYPH
ncbi:hypothetical protein [Gordonia sp. NPDC003950]